MYKTRFLARAAVGWALAIALLYQPLAAAPAESAGASPALRAFIDQAVAQHPRMQAAAAELDRARADLDAADQPLYNPELELDYEKTGIKTQELGLKQAIDWSDKREARTRAASARLAAASARYDAIRQAFVARLMTALVDYQIAAEQLDLAQRRHTLMSRFAEIASQRRQAGDLSQVDFDLAQLAKSEAAMQRARARSELAAKEQALNALAMSNATAWPALPQTLPAIGEQTDIDALVTELPVVIAARAGAAASASVTELRRRESSPDPTFGIRGGKEGEENLVGLTFSIPLFVRNSFDAEVAAARADERAAYRDAAAVERDARARLLATGRRYQAVREAWQEWQQAGASSLARQIEVLERLWQAGELSATDYLVQLKQALDTRSGALDLENESWRAWFDWLEHSGRATHWAGLPDSNEFKRNMK